jgi:hypothetical protein
MYIIESMRAHPWIPSDAACEAIVESPTRNRLGCAHTVVTKDAKNAEVAVPNFMVRF